MTMSGLEFRIGALMQLVVGLMIGLSIASVPYTTDRDASILSKLGCAPWNSASSSMSLQLQIARRLHPTCFDIRAAHD
jgi:hypothetical protein